jgi:hypothetical protein
LKGVRKVDQIAALVSRRRGNECLGFEVPVSCSVRGQEPLKSRFIIVAG